MRMLTHHHMERHGKSNGHWVDVGIIQGIRATGMRISRTLASLFGSRGSILDPQLTETPHLGGLNVSSLVFGVP